jgi:serpin B
MFSLFLAFASLQSAVAGPFEDDKLVSANVGFAFDLMRQVVQAQPDANIFLSPFSVSTVLQMAENGAKGQTKKEMQQVLKTSGLPPGAMHESFKDLNAELLSRKGVTLNLANGIWFQQGLQLKPDFITDDKKFFLAELAGVDFAKPQSAQIINDWADKQTKGRIKNVVQYPFPPLTRLILANAIYFKGQWVVPFDKRLTFPREFHLANGQSKQAPMMEQGGHFEYQENPDFQAVKLPYKGGLQMELFLTGTNSTPQKLVADFAAKENWQKNIQKGFNRREGSVRLPKFRIEYESELNEPLKALGMKSAFAANADFSGIADEPLFISEVKQKSFVDANEEGTKAAAVTTVTVTALSARLDPEDLFRMILDRPFFFVISDMASGSILFMGIVNDPTSGN